MPLEKIKLRPGVDVEASPTLNEGGFSSCQLIRFFSGQLQKYGGWARMAGIGQLAGICRGLFGWADLVGTAHIAAGTDQRLYKITGGVLYDITPVTSTTNAAPALATQAGSTAIVVYDPTYQPKATDTINLPTPVTSGGIILQGYYTVLGTVSSTQYTIQAAAPALATQPSGGSVPRYTTTLNSATVSVQQVSHTQTVGSNYTVNTTTAVGGITLSGNYTVTQVLDANNFRFITGSLASSAATVSENSGQMRILYLLPSGQGRNVSLGGWGVGDWGVGDWGVSNAGVTSSLVVRSRTWSLDHFGQDLIASPDLGGIYHWSPPTVAPATLLDATAPTINRVVFCIAQVQIIMACGSSVGANNFPTLIRWCGQGDFTQWVASTTNQAGSFQIPSGSYVTAAVAVGLGALIWTDVDLWAVTYQGLPFVFGFNQIGVNCEAISKKAPASVGTAVIWPSQRGFFRYSGGAVEPIECSVYDIFYNNLDLNQADTVCSAVNTLFNEVAWFFPTSSGEIWYVKFNYLENIWDYGSLERTAWFDHSPGTNPIATDIAGNLYVHENGNDADGSPMQAFAQSGYYDIQDGNLIQYVNTVIPDFVASIGSAIQITILAVDYPGDPVVRSYGPFTVTPNTKRINCSLRGRQVAFRIASADLGSAWRMAAVRFARKPAGRRP